MILSENDYVADEFRQTLREHAGWRAIGESARLITVAGANHTFSRAAWRDQVAAASSRWVLDGWPQG